MFSDLTMWPYERHRTDWNAFCVDWQPATAEMQDRSPWLFVTIHQRVHLLLTDVVRGEMTMINATTGSVAVATRPERDANREEMRAGLLATLESDWLAYIQSERVRGVLPLLA